MTTIAGLVREFETLLVHKHRFALSNIVFCLQDVIHDLQSVQHALSAHAAITSMSRSDSEITSDLTRISSRLERLVTNVPLFLGLEMPSKLHQSLDMLSNHFDALKVAVAQDAAMCATLTKKRLYLTKFLDEAVQVLQNSHFKRVLQYQNVIEQLTAEFKLAVEDENLQQVKQLYYDIQMIEASMSKMLLPHFEICRTITTAHAQVQPTGGTFSKAECDNIKTFVQAATKLQDGDTTYNRKANLVSKSVLQDAQYFLSQLVLFEQAAQNDAFMVCSSALKLEFDKFLDQELFLAYVEDWNAKREMLQLAESSHGFVAASNHLLELRKSIKHAHDLAQSSQKKLALDDPTRHSILQEVARIFRDEGGVLTHFDLADG
ncbi:uncharacterized protein PHALS_11213 [Plasmopara halstedii]|uniref:Uncharacterized protein n=1 Tax=Plasmopara halstedii TaxID=4781 RepID=A0A0P1AIB3_PLAHL|nr:uncharacterized protein PHALS_11213 [Plasmopara halstedii]CEG41044.1 hypothetical protein PHALS_11213 [Plasmopara halstedii]|eukprot:XP_024577413.1 hypothetical protein PHALS_11213 [Plasmopara halstedii]